MKKIVFVSPYSHHGAPSGARKRAEELCIAILKLNTYKVTFLSPWQPPKGTKHIPFTLDGSVASRLFNLIKLNWLLHRIKPSLVLSESPLCPISLGRFRVLHIIHDAKFASAYGRRGGGITRIMQWISARISSKVVTVSYAERDRISTLLRISQDRIIVSYNGLSELWLTTPLPSIDKKRDFDVIYVSNYAAHKGHLNFLRSVTGLNIRIVFVGADFGELDLCKRFARENNIDVTYYSGISESELISLYDDSRVFVFPSCFEGFGMPFVEARARGLPVIANNILVFQELQSILGGSVIGFDRYENIVSALQYYLDAGVSYLPPADKLSTFSWSSIAEELLMFDNADFPEAR